LDATINSGGQLQQAIVVPEAAVVASQSVEVTVSQQTDSEGDTVNYQQTFAVTNAAVPQGEIAVSVNQLPLAGGLSPIQVQVFNRAFVPMQLVVFRSLGSQPGDLYVSVQNSLG